MTSQTNIDKGNNFVTINAKNLNFYSDKQWEEYDILTNLDGYELDYQDNSSGWIKVVLPIFGEGDGINTEGAWCVADAIRIHKDGMVEHV